MQKVSYWGSASPSRGDIIVFKDPGGWLDETESAKPRSPVTKAMEKIGLYPTGGHLVKRVIGIGGDRVVCCDAKGRITVNGHALNEKSYLPKGTAPSQIKFDRTVPKDHLWMMGDNRGFSYDSRGHMGDPGGGFVDEDLVVGKVFALIWPWKRAEIVHRPATFEGIPDANHERRCLADRRYAGTPVSTATSGRCAGPGWRRSPASTRPVAVPARVRSSRRRRSCPRARPARSRGSPTPSCSPRRRASAATPRSCGGRSPGRSWSSRTSECDRLGMHVANVEALRRSLARLELRPAYVLTDGFPVDGLEVPGLAMWKGDRVAACISAASVIAKVTRDRIMCELHEQYPAYDFATHKGYITEEHAAALTEHGPSPVHRMRFVNVRRAAGIIDAEPLSLEPQLELFEPEEAHLETPVTLQEVCT